MKPTQITTLGIALFLGCAAAHADWSDNLYLHSDVGPAFTPDATTHFRQATAGLSGFNVVTGKGTFKSATGVRGDVSLGYDLNKSWAVEVEAGAIWDPSPFANGTPFYQVPVMLRVLYQVPLDDSWKIYFGAGAGGVVGIEEGEIHTVLFSKPISLDATDTAFGYEAEAGLKYELSRHTELGVGYKFLGVDHYTFDVNTPNFVSHVTVDPLYTHTALLSFTWKF